MQLGNALKGVAIPLHEGAVRFYREMGLIAEPTPKAKSVPKAKPEPSANPVPKAKPETPAKPELKSST